MTIRSKVLDAINQSEALCDDCLSEVTRVMPRQSINIACRGLHSESLVTRPRDLCPRCRRTKIVNRVVRAVDLVEPKPTAATPPPVDTDLPPWDSNNRPWYWEGNVQARIVDFLKSQGAHVHAASDTASRQQGKDIVAADRDGRTLWITVKGFPERGANIQARHWLAGALLDLARYRDESENALLAMGLPHGFRTYEGLLSRTNAVRRFLRYAVYWVKADGTVVSDDPVGRGSSKA